MAEVVFLKTLEQTPRRDTKIYEVKKPVVDERTLLRTAKRFGLKGASRAGQILFDDDEMTYTEGPYEVTFGKASGAMRYSDASRWQVDDGSNIRMSDDDAIAEAKKYVRKYELASLRDCQVLRVSRLRVGTLEQGGERARERVIDVGVLFQRLIDRVPVEGPGGKLMVFLNKEGEMTAVEQVWRPIGRVRRSVPARMLKEPALAESSVRRLAPRLQADRVEVEDMRFGYYEAGVCEVQTVMQPAYVMPLILRSPREEMVVRSLHVVPAAQKPLGRIIPSKRARPAEPVRTG
jgi:hypothetical protein